MGVAASTDAVVGEACGVARASSAGEAISSEGTATGDEAVDIEVIFEASGLEAADSGVSASLDLGGETAGAQATSMTATNAAQGHRTATCDMDERLDRRATSLTSHSGSSNSRRTAASTCPRSEFPWGHQSHIRP